MTGNFVSAVDLPWAAGGAYARAAASWMESEGVLDLHVDSTMNREVLDLSSAPARHVVIHAKGNALPAPGLSVPPPVVRVQLAVAVRRLEVHMSPGQQVSLELPGVSEALQMLVTAPDGHARPSVTIGIGNCGRIDVADCNLSLVEVSSTGRKLERPTPTRCECRQGGVHASSGAIGTMVAIGKCLLDLQGVRLGVLQVAAGAEVRFVGHATSRISLAENRRDKVLPGDLDGFTFRSGTKASCDRIDKARITLIGDAYLSVQRISDSMVEGVGRLRVGFEAANLRVAGGTQISAAPHAQLRGLAGDLRLLGGRHALFAGASGEGFSIAEIVAPATDLEGISLIDVYFPVSRTGLRTMSILAEEASTVVPLIYTDLPGTSRLLVPRRTVTDSQLDMEFGRSLADLAREKGAPASARTYLAACAYRLRQRTCGAPERQILRLYGLLGYGERFLPAFGTFVVLALLMATLSTAESGLHPEFSRNGVDTYLKAVADWLVTPLHVIRLTEPIEGVSQLPQQWDTLARLLVAIPFAVSVLALRNYVKDDHRSRKTS